MSMKKRTAKSKSPAGPRRRLRPPLPVIGWREWAALPDLDVSRIKAKVDTGARSSSLHAFGLEEFKKRGAPWVRFEVHPLQRSKKRAAKVECPVHDVRKVKSSNGKSELRPVIRTRVSLHGEAWDVDVTLTSRDQMGFRMLLGREAVRGRFLIHAGRSYVLDRPKLKAKTKAKAQS